MGKASCGGRNTPQVRQGGDDRKARQAGGRGAPPWQRWQRAAGRGGGREPTFRSFAARYLPPVTEGPRSESVRVSGGRHAEQVEHLELKRRELGRKDLQEPILLEQAVTGESGEECQNTGGCGS